MACGGIRRSYFSHCCEQLPIRNCVKETEFISADHLGVQRSGPLRWGGTAAEPELLIPVCLCQERESIQRVEPGYNPHGYAQ